MLDVGWSEILVIAVILIIVVGPKELPGMLRTFGRMAARVRGMANEFKGQFDEALREAELDDVRKTIGDVSKLNPANSIRDAINPLRKLGEDIKTDLRKASETPVAPTPADASSIGTESDASEQADTVSDKVTTPMDTIARAAEALATPAVTTPAVVPQPDVSAASLAKPSPLASSSIGAAASAAAAVVPMAIPAVEPAPVSAAVTKPARRKAVASTSEEATAAAKPVSSRTVKADAADKPAKATTTRKKPMAADPETPDATREKKKPTPRGKAASTGDA